MVAGSCRRTMKDTMRKRPLQEPLLPEPPLKIAPATDTMQEEPTTPEPKATPQPDKEIIVMGDIEMGAGNLTDDFISDRALSALILQLKNRAHPVDLVLNGDTFDFLKCPSQLTPHTVYPRHITKQVSLAKLKLIYNAHTPVFQALKEFVAEPGKTVYFILGNHDPDIVYPEVQQQLQRLLANNERVIFPGRHYRQGTVHVEHGQQYDFLSAVNFDKLFLEYKGESILNLSFVTFGLISAFMNYKEQYPFMERIFPRPELLTHHRTVARKFNRHTIGYFLKSMVYYPFRFYSDPTYSFPSGLVRELYKRLRTLHWDVDNIASHVLRKRKLKHSIIVLGHIHEKRLVRGKNRVIIHPGSWRDEYDFQSKTRELIPRTKRYVQILVQAGQSKYNLIDIPAQRRIFYFDEVVKDEIGHIKKAAQEENFPLFWA